MRHTEDVVFFVEEMTCVQCERKIEKALMAIEGVVKVKASYVNSTVKVTRDAVRVKPRAIKETLENLGYPVTRFEEDTLVQIENPPKKESYLDAFLMVLLLFFAYQWVERTLGFNFLPEITSEMGYGMLFVVGLMTSIHCVTMCGGINVSQCLKRKPEKGTSWTPSLLYNLGRVISYTLIGGFVGALGSVFNFSLTAKGAIAIMAGLFMVVMGLNLMGVLPSLRRFNLHLPKRVGRFVEKQQTGHKGPFVVGLLNGLMPCGPLQAMQLYALGTGNFFEGALSMFFFSIGTVPLMFGLGAVSTFLGKTFSSKMVKVGGGLVIVLGLVMGSRGLAMAGINPTPFDKGPNVSSEYVVSKIIGDEQVVEISLLPNAYTPIVVQKGIPVRFVIQADSEHLNGCNGAVILPEFKVEASLRSGENTIFFTPIVSGTYTYSCWMGMIVSSIYVVDDLSSYDASTFIAPPVRRGGSCCGG